MELYKAPPASPVEETRPVPNAAPDALEELGRKTFSPRDRIVLGVNPPASPDAVEFALTGPEMFGAASSVVLDVWAFLPQGRTEVWRRARKEHGDETSMKTEGPVMVERGAVLEVTLDIRDLEIPEPRSAIPWTGKIGKTTFLVRVPAGLNPGRREGNASVYLRGVRLARLFFVVEIASTLPADKPTHRRMLENREIRPSTAFVSYASRDRREVLKRVQGIEKAGVDVFLDVKSLRSGERYEQRLLQQIDSRDVFYLFWSQAARVSSWVEKEWRFALGRRGIDFIDPVPLVNPSRVPPPRELADELHFNDWVQAYLASEANGPRWWQFWRR